MTTDDLYMTLLASPVAAGLARTLMQQRLLKWNLLHILDDAFLIVSELIANACEATPNQEIKLHFYRDSAGIVIMVWDSSPCTPIAKPIKQLTLEDLDLSEPTWDANGGWGLPLVQSLSMDCGYSPTYPPGGNLSSRTGPPEPTGKWVWSRLIP